MDVSEWLGKVAYISDSEIPDDNGKVYYSKFDGSYITRVGMEENVEFLANREITEELTHGVGFSLKDNKWYGWSHRAIKGFCVGATCQRGDCHYLPENKEDFLESLLEFWDEEHREIVRGVHTPQEIMDSQPTAPGEAEQVSVPSGKFEKGVYIEWRYSDKLPNKKLRNTLSGIFTPYPESFGRGEWTAKTLGDAKQMAIDFNESVS